MGDMKYFDFDVAIEPAGDSFTARVFNSPVGQAAATFGAPFSDLEIENFLLRIGRSRHAVRRIESPELASAKQFGGRLFDQVFAGEVRGCLRSSLDEAGRQGAGLRVRLHLAKVPALADLPWEFLYNASMNRFLSLSVETPLVRYLELPERIRPLIVQPPLRVLMMISSPSDYPQLDVKRETAKISEALGELEQRGLVTVERQEDATLAELQRRLRNGQYHIFHFVGHGGFDTQAEDGLLIMEDQENRGRRVSAQFLGTLLHDHRPLRLAVLNACEGARASRGDPFAGTAQSLVQQGIPAVIAMQFEVTDEAAICFTREFYSAIAVGYPVDAALAEARKSIFAEVSEVEWGTPVLYMRSPDGKVFEVEQISEPARKQLHITSLLTAAQTATASDDHRTAIDKLNQVLALEPDNAAAAALLADVAREQELGDLYAAARTSYDAGQWRDALDRLRRLQGSEPAYRDTQTLIEAAEKAMAKATGEEERAQRASELRRAAMGAMAAELWTDAIAKWQALLGIDPEDRHVRAQLGEAHRQQELATLYARARGLADRRLWRDALADLRHLQRLAPEYKDAAARAAAIELELKTLADEQSGRQTAAQPEAGRNEAATTKSGARRPVGWLFMGGALGAAAVIALLVFGGVAMVVFMAGRQSATQQSTESTTQPVVHTSSVTPAPPVSQQPAPAAVQKTPPPASAPVRENPPRRAPSAPAATVQPAPAPREVPPPAVVRPANPQPASPSVQTVQQLLNDMARTPRAIPSEPAPKALDNNQANAYPPANARPAAPAPVVMTPALRQILVDTIRYADAAEIQAYRTLSAAPLTPFYVGDLLQTHLANLQDKIRNRVFEVHKLHQQHFESFAVSADGTRAQVRMTEYWSTDTHSIQTGRCLSHIHEHPLPQTVSLQLTNEGWKIYSAEFHTKDSPPTVQCH